MRRFRVSPGWGLLIYLLLFIGLGWGLSLAIPLGEAPDEFAHFRYLQFVAEAGRLPINQTEREAAGYRSDWPGLYQVLVAPVVALTKQEGPLTLKPIGVDRRRLLVFDGLRGLAVIHTDDETWPYRGIVLSWHVARLFSTLFSAGTLLFVFLILRNQFSAETSLLAIMLVGLIPQFFTMSAVINDDSLLGLLAALFLWLLWPLFERDGSPGRYLALGLTAGLALVTKYSTLFLSLDLVLVLWIFKGRLVFKSFGIFCAGLVLGSGWWFGFVAYHFNQIASLGWFRGLLAPFLAGGTDVSTRRIATWLQADTLTTPLAVNASTDWLVWGQELFTSFWFPGPVPIWIWGALLILVICLAWGVVRSYRGQIVPRAIIFFSSGHIALFLPLLLLRFYLTGNIAETAQGRHLLFPILVPFALLVLTGLAGLGGEQRTKPIALSRGPQVVLIGWGAGLLISLVAVVWPDITLADVPYLPVRTMFYQTPQRPLGMTYQGQLTLLGLDEAPTDIPYGDAFPLTLLWRAETIPAIDYTIRATLLNNQNQVVGVWRGQPVNGQYPTRAWDKGDIVRHTLWIPTIPGLPAGDYKLRLQVFDDRSQPVWPDEADTPAVEISDLTLPRREDTLSSPQSSSRNINHLRWYVAPRGDRLPADAPYRYRGTVALVITPSPDWVETIVLRDPVGNDYPPLEMVTAETGRILLFTVDWRWLSGDYGLVFLDQAERMVTAIEAIVSVSNKLRRQAVDISLSGISRPLQANFNDQFLLLGYDLPKNRVRPGQSFEVILYWQSLRLTNRDYKVFNHLLDADYVQRGGRDRTPQNFYSPILWHPGELVVDRYPVPVASDAPDGIYWLDVGLYEAQDPVQSPLPLSVEGAIVAENSVRLGPLKVGGQPISSVVSTAPAMERDDRFGDLIMLRGYEFTLDPAAEALALSLYWMTLSSPPRDYTVFVHLVDQDDNVVAQADGLPVSGRYPTSFWEPEEYILDRRQVSLAGLAPGPYQIRLGWYDAVSGHRLPVVDNPAGFVVLDTVRVGAEN